jgi:uncharacterized protein (TIGR00266 family)
MEYKIRGSIMQVVDVELNAGESVYTESGGMVWMSPNIEMSTNTKGGLMKGLGRMLAGESLFMNIYKCTEGKGVIAFSNEFPGKVIELDLKAGQEMIAQKDAFMFAESSVTMAMHFRKKLGAGLFGGEGFIMQKLTGPGKAFLELGGEITEYTLKEGQVLKVDPGHVGAFEPTVNFDVSMVKGVTNMFFGGEGLFLAQLTGPGKVWLQSMTVNNLASRIIASMPGK